MGTLLHNTYLVYQAALLAHGAPLKKSHSEIDATFRQPMCIGKAENYNAPQSYNAPKVSAVNSPKRPRWENAYTDPITYKIKKTDSMPERYSTSNNFRSLRTTMQKAFKLWEQETQLRFVEITNDDTAEIVVSFEPQKHGDNSDFDGKAGTLAHAFGPDYKRHRKDIRGDIHFDAAEPWVYSEPTDKYADTNIYAVAIHELGHALGLPHNTEDQNSIMWFMTHDRWDVKADVLPDADRRAILDLYGDPVAWYKRPEVIVLFAFAAAIALFVGIYLCLRKTGVIEKNERWKSLKHRVTRFSRRGSSNPRGNPRGPPPRVPNLPDIKEISPLVQTPTSPPAYSTSNYNRHSPETAPYTPPSRHQQQYRPTPEPPTKSYRPTPEPPVKPATRPQYNRQPPAPPVGKPSPIAPRPNLPNKHLPQLPNKPRGRDTPPVPHSSSGTNPRTGVPIIGMNHANDEDLTPSNVGNVFGVKLKKRT